MIELSGFWKEAINEVDGAFLISHGNVMVATGTVAAFLEWMKRSGKGLLGAEGFNFDGEHLIPRLDCIIDYPGGDSLQSIAFIGRTIAENSEFRNIFNSSNSFWTSSLTLRNPHPFTFALLEEPQHADRLTASRHGGHP